MPIRPLLLCLVPLALISVMAHAADAPTIRGQVRDEAGPVAGARVRIKGTKCLAQTDTDGRFELTGAGERITAWKAGYFIAGVPTGRGPLELRLRPLPKEDNPDYAWVDPHPSKEHAHNCGNCHSEIFREWAASAHGRAGRNKHFLNLYDGTDWHGRPDRGWSLLTEHPDGAAVCAACHAPTVPFDHPGFLDFRKLDGVHARGVHCDYCHKIADVSTAKLGLEHGRFAHTLLRPKEGQLFFGPLDDVDRDEDVYAPFYSESRYCAACHEGTVFGAKVYTTYSEWLASPAGQQGQQCQSCHMAPTGAMDNIAPGRGGIKRDPLTLASHHMPGGTPDMLTRCLRLSVTLRREQGVLHVATETLATNVGHRVPTGFIDRNLILVVEPLTAAGTRARLRHGPTLPGAAGTGDPEKGNFAGLPGRFYAKQLEDEAGRRPVPFWRSNREHADTRLVPDQPDRTGWRFDADGVQKVRVRLVYRRFFKAVADSKSWPDNDTVVIDATLDAPAEGRTVEWQSGRPKQ
jgi:hypothetical protein